MTARQVTWSRLAAGLGMAIVTLATASAQTIGERFEVVPNAGIPGFNQEVINGLSLAECQGACLGRDWCRSVDFERATGRCYIQPVDMKQKPLKRDYPDHPYDHYTRLPDPDRAQAMQQPAAPASSSTPTDGLATAERQQVFDAPMIDGHRLDICLRWGEACGKPAADAFCTRNGFEQASGFVPDHDIGARVPTKVLSSGQICDEQFCDGFKTITCQGGSGSPAAGAVSCAREKETYAQAARAWQASGRNDQHRRTMLLARQAFETCREVAAAAASGPPSGSGVGTTMAASGWQVNLGTLDVSGDVISTRAPGDGETSYYIAPAVFHGDWTGARAIVLEKKSSGGDYYSSGYGAHGDIILSGSNGTARYLLPEDHSGDWKAFRVPLDGTGWRLDGAQSLAAVLSDVTDFRIRAEYGVGDDTSAIRGVMLDHQGPALPPDTATDTATDTANSGAAGYAGVWDSSEGRMTLTASGDRISGTYPQDNGAVTGTVQGARFDGFWIEDGSGRRCDTARDGRHHWGRLVFDRTGDTLTGKWSYCEEDPSAPWTATRVGPAPGDPPPRDDPAHPCPGPLVRSDPTVPTAFDGRSFVFGRGDGSVIARDMRLGPGGAVQGYSHANESAWGLKGGRLVFLNREGVVTTCFDQQTRKGNTLTLAGRFLGPDGTRRDGQASHVLTLDGVPAGVSAPGLSAGSGRDSDASDPPKVEDDGVEDEKPDLTIREDLDVSGLIQQIEAIMAEEEGQ